MKTSFVPVVLFVVALLIHDTASPPMAIAQDACTLTSWMASMPPHTQRTPELPATDLRDTMIGVNGFMHKVSIPPGFTISVFALLPQCRGLAWSPDNVLYATSNNGCVYALPAHHGTYPDSTIVVASGLGDPHGIGFYNGNLYVSNNAALYRIQTNGLSRIALPQSFSTPIAPLPASGGHHSRNFVFDTTKKKIYVQIGSNGNFDTTDIAHRAQIVEMNVDGTGYRTFARGVRNAVGMDIDPRSGALWVNNNGMDNVFGSSNPRTNDNPSESIYMVCDGANYGWPWCYAYQMRNPQMMNLDTSVVLTFNGPVAEILAHEAPLGFHFYRGTAFPAKYHNAIFQCYHGSWDRQPPAPPRVTVMWADSDGQNASVTDFVNGFQPDSTGTRWARPVSVIEGTDDALYVSSDSISPTYSGAIFRIAWIGAPASVSTSKNKALLSIGNPIPNPMRDAATIPVTLREPSFVRAEVFDVLGNLVATPFSGTMSGGDHTLSLDLKGHSPGDYIVRITADNVVISKHVVLTH